MEKYYDINVNNCKFKIKINNKNIPSIPVQRVIHLSVINWLNRQINNNIFKTYINQLNQPCIAINYLLYDHPTKVKPPKMCRVLDTTNQVILCSSQ